MNRDRKIADTGKGKMKDTERIKKREKKIDEEIEQTFPASDPPSYSQPGNDDDDKEE